MRVFHVLILVLYSHSYIHYVSVVLPTTTGATVPSASPTTMTTTVEITTATTEAKTTTEEPPPTTVATTIPPLTVSIVSSGGTLRAGQNHILTCEASGGGSTAYTYMWLKDGSVMTDQTSSTYSFSPLLAVHSGQYSCRVLVGSMTAVTSGGVDITVESESGYDHA